MRLSPHRAARPIRRADRRNPPSESRQGAPVRPYTHRKASESATTVITDVVCCKWIADFTSTGETSVQVQAAFNRALRDEMPLDEIEERSSDVSIPRDPEDDCMPVLLVTSDNGPQMTSRSTREFMAPCWPATHYGRPHTPTDQAWIESFLGQLKRELRLKRARRNRIDYNRNNPPEASP